MVVRLDGWWRWLCRVLHPSIHRPPRIHSWKISEKIDQGKEEGTGGKEREARMEKIGKEQDKGGIRETRRRREREQLCVA